MSKIKDLLGVTFSRLKVVEFSGLRKEGIRSRAFWKCMCECGNMVEVAGNLLTTGNTKSCGCLLNDTIGDLNKTHGKSRTTEYESWCAMKSRCYNEKNHKYPVYGGRGIKICDRWLGGNGFANFLIDMGSKPSMKHSIDRFPNNDGDYEPSNCRWATSKQQGRNMQNTLYVVYKGEKRVLRDVCEEINVRIGKIKKRSKYRNRTLQSAFDEFVKPKSTLINHSFGYIN